MKKVLVLFMILVFTLSMTLNALAVPGKGKGNGNGNGGNKSEIQTTTTSETGQSWSNKTGNLIKIYNEDGTKVMVPVRALYNHGATNVEYDVATDSVTITGANGITVEFKPNSKTATTKASVALGDLTTSALEVTDQTAGTIAGTVPATITDPLSGEVIAVTLNVTATSTGLVDTAGVLDGPIAGTMTGNYTDATGQVVTVTGTVAGLLSDPDFALDGNTVDFNIPFENQESNGRAYVPIQDLDKLFATELAADTTEPAPAEPAPEEVVPEVPEV